MAVHPPVLPNPCKKCEAEGLEKCKEDCETQAGEYEMIRASYRAERERKRREAEAAREAKDIIFG